MSFSDHTPLQTITTELSISTRRNSIQYCHIPTSEPHQALKMRNFFSVVVLALATTSMANLQPKVPQKPYDPCQHLAPSPFILNDPFSPGDEVDKWMATRAVYNECRREHKLAEIGKPY